MTETKIDEFDFTSVMSKDLIDLSLDVHSKLEAIQALTELLYKSEAISDKKSFIEDVLLRESEGVTGLGQGLAIPHGKSNSVERTSIVLGRTLRPIEWESLDDEPVTFIILFAVKNVEANTKHIQLLQRVAIKLADDDFIKNIHLAPTPEAVLGLFAEENE